MRKYMVFDVESIGLHGEGFAVAWVVVSEDGQRLEEGLYSVDPDMCQGTDADRAWVAENVPLLEANCATKEELYDVFWAAWLRWKSQNAFLTADCAWPVETNFLSACVRAKPEERAWEGPYPLLDLANVVTTLSGDATKLSERHADELPAHHPLMDTRQSARVLVRSLATAASYVARARHLARRTQELNLAAAERFPNLSFAAARGFMYGYPGCCIEAFEQSRLLEPNPQKVFALSRDSIFCGTGFVPCAACRERPEAVVLLQIQSLRDHRLMPFPIADWSFAHNPHAWLGRRPKQES